ncbi:MAG: hypothetical protein PHX62_02015 [Bacilli bacterium]|nr:hypothetical protein [Bacilli bacterium]
MSLKQYRNLDLLMLSILAIISEFLGTFLLEKLSVGFTISFASLIAIIAIFRWGYRGGLAYVLAGIPMLFLYQEYSFLNNLLYYLIGGSFIFIIPIVFKNHSLDAIRNKSSTFNLFIIFLYLSIVFGKSLTLFVLGENLFSSLRAVMGSFLFTIVISIIILNLLKKTSGLITDMTALIKESQLERNYEARSENA